MQMFRGRNRESYRPETVESKSLYSGWKKYVATGIGLVGTVVIGCASDSEAVSTSETITDNNKATVESFDPTATPKAELEPYTGPPNPFDENGKTIYESGIFDGGKYVESLDGTMRVEALGDMDEDQLGDYLDRAYKANVFVSDFFDKDPMDILVSINGDMKYNVTETNEFDINGGQDLFGWDIDSHFNLIGGYSFVHELTHDYVNKFMFPDKGVNEFVPIYLGTLTAFSVNDNWTFDEQKISEFTYDCENCDLISSDTHVWAIEKLIELEDFDFDDHKKLIGILTDRFDEQGRIVLIGLDDYRKSIEEIIKSKSATMQ